jgi:hypothetical protein
LVDHDDQDVVLVVDALSLDVPPWGECIGSEVGLEGFDELVILDPLGSGYASALDADDEYRVAVEVSPSHGGVTIRKSVDGSSNLELVSGRRQVQRPLDLEP